MNISNKQQSRRVCTSARLVDDASGVLPSREGRQPLAFAFKPLVRRITAPASDRRDRRSARLRLCQQLDFVITLTLLG
jgi:hypothetical protein